MESKKNDFKDDKLRWDLLPLDLIEEIVKVYHAGAKKYGPNTWQGLPDGYNRYRGALLRHLVLHEKGETFDKETGCRHLAQVAWNAIAMLYFSIEKEDKKYLDDFFKDEEDSNIEGKHNDNTELKEPKIDTNALYPELKDYIPQVKTYDFVKDLLKSQAPFDKGEMIYSDYVNLDRFYEEIRNEKYIEEVISIFISSNKDKSFKIKYKYKINKNLKTPVHLMKDIDGCIFRFNNNLMRECDCESFDCDCLSDKELEVNKGKDNKDNLQHHSIDKSDRFEGEFDNFR